MTSSRFFLSRLAVPVVLVAMAAILYAGVKLGTPERLNDFLIGLGGKLNAYTERLPEDRVYVQTDKPFYYPGEDIWFAAYARDGMTLRPSGLSDIVHVELINPKGTTERHIQIVAKNGVAAGDFHLGEEAAGGLYKIKAYTQWQKNEVHQALFEKEIQIQKVVLPNLKMKLEFERKAYGPGDEVTALLDLQTNENQPLSNKEFNYVVSLAGNSVATLSGKTDGIGAAKVKFKLPGDLNTADGLLNVMISHNGLTESVSRSVPITLNKIGLELFPEGGDLVANLHSRVAFRAKNEFGKPADISGEVVDQAGKVISTFRSFHDGMGSFDFTPKKGEIYTARITQPVGVKETYPLPEALPMGYVLNVGTANPNYLPVTIFSGDTDVVNLVAQVRSKIYWKSELDVRPGKNDFLIPMGTFPIGVAQVTLFDRHGIERAERLAFVNNHKQLNVSIETDKEKYLPREKVKMTVRVTDERGMPMPATLSMSVVNDQLLSFADYKGGNILSQLLVEQELKEKVYEPAFYFDKTKPEAAQALDYLLMTSGWRRFEWQEIQNNRLPNISFAAEAAIFSGQVLNAVTGQPVADASILFPKSGMGILADPQGRFKVRGLDLGLEKEAQFSAKDLEPQNYPLSYYGPNQVVYMYPKGYEPPHVRWDFDGEEERMEMVPAVEDAPARGAVQNRPMVAMAPGKGEGVKRANVPPDMGVKLKNVVAASPDPEIEKEKKGDERHQPGEKPEDLVGNHNNREFDLIDGEVVDERMVLVDKNLEEKPMGQAPVGYYRARVFPVPAYKIGESPANGVRTDFRSTLYWNPLVEVDRSGKTQLEFFANDEITSFRATVEGIGMTGAPGRAEKVFFTQMPFSMQARVPVEVATGDLLNIPLTLKNNSDKVLAGKLSIQTPEALVAAKALPTTLTLQPGQSTTIALSYQVKPIQGEKPFQIAFEANGIKDAFIQPLKIVSRGFPVQLSLSGKEKEKGFKFRSQKLVEGSTSITFTAYPNVVSDLMKGIESILREPYGCFEQTSTSTYPNTLVLRYLQQQENPDPKFAARAKDLLDKGYKRLTTFETKEKGYEWFGSNPPHEALTAYGVMQFADMKRVGAPVDDAMMDRTLQWLLGRRDGNGGFKRDPKALDSFGGASPEITNAYIVYALAEAGVTDLKKEADAAYNDALKSGDPYRLGLMANALFALKDKTRGQACLDALLAKQDAKGSFTGTSHSITRSTGQGLSEETTSLALMAMIKGSNVSGQKVQDAATFLVNARSGYGGYSNTQSTIMALRALTDYAEYSKKTKEPGDIEIWIDGKKVATQHYDAGIREAVEIKGLEKFAASEGEHEVQVKFSNCKEALPWSVAVAYNTYLPQSDTACVADLKVSLAQTQIKMGETVRMNATLTNRTQEGQPMTMAILGIPAGLSAQPWQLKEMQEKGIFDFYEVIGNNLVCYYRQMKPGEVRQIALDLKADIPGEYDAPASRAYLYYTAEHKTWTSLPRVTVTP